MTAAKHPNGAGLSLLSFTTEIVLALERSDDLVGLIFECDLP